MDKEIKRTIKVCDICPKENPHNAAFVCEKCGIDLCSRHVYHFKSTVPHEFIYLCEECGKSFNLEIEATYHHYKNHMQWGT